MKNYYVRQGARMLYAGFITSFVMALIYRIIFFFVPTPSPIWKIVIGLSIILATYINIIQVNARMFDGLPGQMNKADPYHFLFALFGLWFGIGIVYATGLPPGLTIWMLIINSVAYIFTPTSNSAPFRTC